MTPTFIVAFLLAAGFATFGVRRQSEAATAFWIGVRQTLVCRLLRHPQVRQESDKLKFVGLQSGVALRLPRHSKTDQVLPQSAKIESTFDTAKNVTTVRLAPVQISGEKDKYHSLHFSAAFSYPGQTPQKPETLDFELNSIVKRQKLHVDLDVVFVVDGETIFLSSNRSAVRNPVPGRRWIRERLVFRMPYETLLKITKARAVEIKMDAVRFEIGETQLQAIRDFARQMDPVSGSL